MKNLSKGFIEALESAFPPSNPPSTITASRTPDCVEINSMLEGIPWKEVKSSTIEQLVSDLPLCTDEYFRYILPAYIRNAYESEKASAVDFIVCALETDSPHSSGFAKFNTEQKIIIKRFLQWAGSRLNNEDATKA